ncbi:uncharacterized protein LOC142981280 [Anticarsia gemmatalis]|uniref:uncharacterized protein LOC142981280 n=1 Tax=Anticarsia gemmatalis TaxID=129554 RepID=UPI003F775767
MHFKQFVVSCVLGFLLQRAAGEAPQFRILAPPFVCPKDKDAVIDKPDNTVVTLQTDAGADVTFTWTVRWYPLVAPSQRLTVALWRTVRALEKQLNGMQAEPGVYVIDNNELLSGVNYIFNVTATSNDTESVEKSFHIDNMQGDQKLLIEGRSDKFSIVLVGGQLAYADIPYMLEALVTTCVKTHDYYFVWSVSSAADSVDVSDVKGSRLELEAHSLTPGVSYNVLCKVYKYSTKEFITQNGLPFTVEHRDLSVNFNVDILVVSVSTPFTMHTDIKHNDYLINKLIVTFECSLNDEPFTEFESDADGSLIFPSGLPQLGEYSVTVTVTVVDKPVTSQATTRIVTVEAQLPVIEVHPITRSVNEDSIVQLKANVSGIVPGCSITWYFNYDECLSPTNNTDMTKCTDNEQGIPISDTINFYSLEENFLSELTDFSNETSWKLVDAELVASDGRARILAECECNRLLNCTNDGRVYADVQLRINEKPAAGEVMITPDTGTAMETIFRISTLALIDANRPLRYTFYCDIGNNDSLVIGVYLEHLAIETLLPYVGV